MFKLQFILNYNYISVDTQSLMLPHDIFAVYITTNRRRWHHDEIHHLLLQKELHSLTHVNLFTRLVLNFHFPLRKYTSENESG